MGDHRPEFGILGEQFEQDRRARSGRPDDEQRLDDLFVERIDGSYSGVVGLPLYETARLLLDFGYAPGFPGYTV